MKKALLALAVAGAAVSAQADTKLSGHVNYAAGDFNDFNANQNLTVNDATTSQSRFRITSSKKADGVTYGLKQEFGLNNGAVAIRVNEFWLKGDFGKVSVGQGSESGDGATEADYSGTYLLNGAAYNTWGLNARIQQLDGGRDERIRYDSAKIGGVATISLDIDTNDDFGAAIRLGGSNWKAALYTESRDANGSDETGGSFAIKAGVITAAFQFATLDETTNGANDDRDFTKVILGYRSGPISVSIDTASSETDNGLVADEETTGLNVVYRPTKGVELYGGIRNAENKLTRVDGDGFLVGGRIKF